MRSSVVIPAYNAAGTITRCLQALASQDISSEEFEVLVVDDGSTDGTAERVEEFGSRPGVPATRALRRRNSGPAAARNAGAEEARGEILLFTDSDCFPEPDWLRKMLEPFEDPEVVGVKGAYLSEQRSWTAKFVQLEYASKYRRMRRFSRIDFIDTYSAGFRRDVFLQAGGFDPAFAKASVEDQEFSFRLAAKGLKMVFAPAALVTHLHVDNLPGYIRKKYKIGYYKALLLTKHPGRASGDTHTPRALKLQIGMLFLLLAAIPIPLLTRAPWGLVGVPAAFYLFSMGPLLLFILRRNPLIALLSPIMITCRAAALGAGLLAGMIRFFPSKAPR